ncbi:hypothetical protein DNTS_028705, partial [Danionella cerebrum]
HVTRSIARAAVKLIWDQCNQEFPLLPTLACFLYSHFVTLRPNLQLHTGWSFHTFQSERQRKAQMLEKKELDFIMSVLH